ncbi:MAG: hypothetical protein GY864_04735 [Desulfobacterales bacterium]|nr:hypothetical protein [Desulfobacterales bacterium]
MPYEIVFTRTVRRQIADLPGYIKAIAKKCIAGLSDEPYPSRSKELEGHPDYYRLWLGPHFRLVWHVHEEERVVEIEYVGPKPPDLYDRLGLARPKSPDRDDH